MSLCRDGTQRRGEKTEESLAHYTRLQGAPGDYYASPVAADGKIYAVSEEGKASVIEAGREWRILKVNDLGDGSKGTLAIADGRLYIRTYGTLYCFSKPR